MYNFHQSRQHFFFAPCIGEDFIGCAAVHVYSFPIEIVDFLRAVGQEGSCPYFHVCDDVIGFPVYEEDEAGLMESFYVFISFNDSASGGYDEVLTEGEVLNCPFFCVAEGFFAFGEEAFDGPFSLFSRYSSASMKVRERISAMALPKVVLPLPGMPMRTIFFISSCPLQFLPQFQQGFRGPSIFLRRPWPA